MGKGNNPFWDAPVQSWMLVTVIVGERSWDQNVFYRFLDLASKVHSEKFKTNKKVESFLSEKVGDFPPKYIWEWETPCNTI